MPLLPEVHLPRLTGQMLANVVKRKGVTAGSLDGWGWRELKVLPLSWYDELARILTKVEHVGVWLDGLLDAYNAMIPKTDGDATLLSQRPLSVLRGRWTCSITQVVQRAPLWPASWLPAVGESRGSKSVEVRRDWDTHDERPQFMSRRDALLLDDSLADGDVSRAWAVWSVAAESALADAYRFSGGPLPGRGLVLGRGRASFRVVKLGGHEVRKARGYAADAHDAADVFLYRDSSIAPLLDMRCRLKAVMELHGAMIRCGVSLSRSLELSAQWDRILIIGPLFPGTLNDLQVVRGVGLGDCHGVCGIHRRLSDFIHAIVVHTRDEAIRGWRNWIREDPLVHPYKWLRPDLVPPPTFLQCEPHLSPCGSGVLSDPSRIDEEFRKAWLHYFCRSGQREARLEEFDDEVVGWLPLLPEVSLPCLTGQMLANVVKRKGVTAGSLDGWGWRELKVLPLSWYDELARILSKVEDVGVWPDELLDAYIVMIPKTDGDATPLGQRPLSVLPVIVFGLRLVWVSLVTGLSLGFLTLFSVLVVVVGRLRLGILLLLILRKFLLVLLIPMFISLLLMSSSRLIRLIVLFLIVS